MLRLDCIDLRFGPPAGTMRRGENQPVMRIKIPSDECRPAERLRQHYEIEKELGARLRNAGKQERTRLYQTVYDELFQRVWDHPQVTAPNRASHQKKVASQARLVKP